MARGAVGVAGDRSTPRPKVGRSLATTTAFFAIFGFGAFINLYGPYNVGEETGRAVLPPSTAASTSPWSWPTGSSTSTPAAASCAVRRLTSPASASS